MTEGKTKIEQLPINRNPIPTREEFHRYATDILSEADFCTNYPTGYTIDKTAKSIAWTLTTGTRKL